MFSVETTYYLANGWLEEKGAEAYMEAEDHTESEDLCLDHVTWEANDEFGEVEKAYRVLP